MGPKGLQITLASILALLTVGLFLAYTGYKKVDDTINLMEQIDKEEIKNMTNDNLSEMTRLNLKEQWIIAIFGIDSRDGDNLSGSNSDVIILASINNKTGAISLISVYRDTCLKTGDNRYRKVNEAYATGGPKKAVEVLNENLDLEIDDYIAVNWKAVATAINILGGIEMEVTDSEWKYINGYITETVKSTGIGSVQLKASGMQALDGIQAVAYSRIRYTSGNDFRRTERQRDVLAALLDKAKKSDWATLNNVIETVFPMTASSIDTKDVIGLALNLPNYEFVGSIGFPFELKTKVVDGQDFVFPVTLESNVMDLHSYLYGLDDYTVSDSVKRISEKIETKYHGNSSVQTKSVERMETLCETDLEEAETETASLEEENYNESITEETETTLTYNEGPGFSICQTEELEAEVTVVTEEEPETAMGTEWEQSDK